MLIRNVRLLDPTLFGASQQSFNGSVLVNLQGQLEFPPLNDVPADCVSFDAKGALLLPGLIDTHIHGCHGADFADGAISGFDKISEQLGKAGVAFCYATFVSLPLSELKYALMGLDQYISSPRHAAQGRARIIGVHLEGPYISAACCGAHSKSALLNQISVEEFKEIVAAAPNISEWKLTLAPDVLGAIQFIREASKGLSINGKSVHVSIYLGHSNAAPQLIQAALAAGAVGFTHLGNANAETKHRSDKPLTAEDLTSAWVKTALQYGDKNAEIIADGNHVSPEFIKLVYRHFKNTILLISDALRPAGEPDGEYSLGTLPVIKKEGRIVLKKDETKLAGSAMLLPQMLPFYREILQTLSLAPQEIEQAWLQTLYYAPRRHYQGPALPEVNNFILLDAQSGDVIAHMTNRQIFLAEKKSLKPAVKLFDQMKLTSPRNEASTVRIGCHCEPLKE